MANEAGTATESSSSILREVPLPAQENGVASSTALVPAKEISPQTAAEIARPAKAEVELSAPELFLNRELTWLAFNRRVFEEALDERNPLLERLKFLAITASNLDEFFMKRIGGLKQQAAAGVKSLTADGRTPQMQISECLVEIRAFESEQRALLPELLKRLAEADIHILAF